MPFPKCNREGWNCGVRFVSPVNCVPTTNITIFIYNWLLKYILTILPVAEPGPLEVRGDGERPRGVLPLPGSLASPTLADNWLIPKRQNVLVRDICMLTLLIFSKGNCPSYPFLLRGRTQSELLWAVTDIPPSPSNGVFGSSWCSGASRRGWSPVQHLCFILVCERARGPPPEKTFNSSLNFWGAKQDTRQNLVPWIQNSSLTEN